MTKKQSNSLAYFQVSDKKYVSQILQLSNNLLLDSTKYETFSSNSLEKLANSGFVVGKFTKKRITDFLINENNCILVSMDKSRKLLAGYILLISTDEIKEEVKGYSKDVLFEDSKYEKIFNSGNFTYLLQIAVDKAYQNQGIGSNILKTAYSLIDVPIISFIVKKPIRNVPSLYTHLKNGFEYIGDYIGDYAQFKDYRSVGLMYIPGNKEKSKKQTLLDLEFIYNK